jgi:lysyl-tRNA synthetase, class II
MSQVPENESIESQRLTKLGRLKELEINPYPARAKRSHNIIEVHNKYFSEEEVQDNPDPVIVCGRVMAKRPMGKAAFFHIVDESGKIQIYANNKLLEENQFQVLKQLDIGDIVSVKGKPFRTKTREASIEANNLEMLSKSLAPIPIVKEKDGQLYDEFSDKELRYRQRYLDLIVNENSRTVFYHRSKFISLLRSYLQERNFIEVETPMMQAIASGAAAKPFETFHNALSMPLFLRIAPELFLKRLIVGGYERVFELNRNFRNEGISTKHNPEFTMMELYQAYADFEDMMSLVEDMLEYLAIEIHGSTALHFDKQEIELKKPWQRMGYLEAIKHYAGIDFEPLLNPDQCTRDNALRLADSSGLKLGDIKSPWDIVDEVFSALVEPKLQQPVFICDFPVAISPLAKARPDQPLLAERFEPYICGWEIGNAFSELNDPIEQQRRFEEQMTHKQQGMAETMEMDEDFIQALKVGMPPTGGLGLGIDRLVMLFTNSLSIRDVILFPTLRKKNEQD